MSIKYAPIYIPTLCRDEHFITGLESLKKNRWAKYTDVYIALDYPAKESHWEGYRKICEYLDLDPYSLSSAGACLIAAANGDRTGAALTKAGIPFAVIGHLADGNDCILHFADRIRYLNRP